jgi:hypothetical protein
MSLEKILDKMKITGIAGVVALSIGFPGYMIGYQMNVKKHLKPNSILFSITDNLIIPASITLPLAQNRDVDHDGYFESVMIYKDTEGRKRYQEIVRTEAGLVLGKPKFYE